MKTILSTVRGWVLVGVVLGSGGAWGQETGETTLTAKNGCKLIHTIPSHLLSRFKAIQLRNVAPASKCNNGYFEGTILYGYETTFIQTGTSNFNKVPQVQASIMQGGRSNGIYLRFTTSRRANLGGGQTFWSFEKDHSSYSLQKSIDLIQEDGSKSNHLAYATNVNFLSEILKIWDADPDKFIQEYTNDASGSTIAYTFKATAPPVQPPRGDDPKVFGRSARGG